MTKGGPSQLSSANLRDIPQSSHEKGFLKIISKEIEKDLK